MILRIFVRATTRINVISHMIQCQPIFHHNSRYRQARLRYSNEKRWVKGGEWCAGYNIRAFSAADAALPGVDFKVVNILYALRCSGLKLCQSIGAGWYGRQRIRRHRLQHTTPSDKPTNLFPYNSCLWHCLATKEVSHWPNLSLSSNAYSITYYAFVFGQKYSFVESHNTQRNYGNVSP